MLLTVVFMEASRRRGGVEGGVPLHGAAPTLGEEGRWRERWILNRRRGEEGEGEAGSLGGRAGGRGG